MVKNMTKCNIILCLLCFSVSVTHGEYVFSSTKDNSFDFIIFTQHWPITVCKEWVKENHSHTCKFPKRQQSWTIHGIWPTKNGTMGPAFCNNSWHFDPEQVKPIENKLLDLWIDVENSTSEYSLWVHEWTKHGTCAANLQVLNSEFKYFSRGINWMPMFDLSKALANHNIVPSDDRQYSLPSIQQAIINTWNVNPQIECRYEKGIQLLFEIRLCFDKTLNLMDCYSNHNSILTNCNVNHNAAYPKTLSPGKRTNSLYVQVYKLISWLRWFTL